MKIIVDPFTKLGFEIEIQRLGEGQYRAEGFLIEKSRRESLCKAALIQPGHPPKVQRGPLLQQLASDIDFVWLQRVYPRPALLSEEQLLAWHTEWKEEKEDAPNISFPPIEEKKPEIWPILKLKDRFGAFADLWMDYIGKQEIAFHDSKARAFRDEQAEKSWERDLLETGFQAKQVDSSHYYCPMDKVASSLSFLLDIGWKIVDFQGKRVIRQDKASFEIEEHLVHLTLRGKVKFGEHEVDLASVSGACQKKEKFFDLSENTVGLIDESTLPPSIAEFSLEKGVLKVPKSRFAVLEKLSCPQSLQEILSLALGDKNEQQVMPSGQFRGKLHPYQMQGLQWLFFLKKQNLAGLLADEMGLGKTVQVLALLSLLDETSPVLLVAPTSLLFHWKKECERFLPELSLYMHSGSIRRESFENVRVILTSYALLRQDRALFSSQEYSCMILDEAQMIKNPDSQIAEVVCSLKSNFRLGLSGTPVENHKEDLWSLFRFLLPELLGEKTTFLSRMAEYNKKLIAPFVLRRKKEIVAHQLPPKLEQIVWIEMKDEQRHLYEQVLSMSRKQIALDASNHLQILEKILRLRQICCDPALIGEGGILGGKLERLMEDLEEIIAEGRKALIYSQFTSMLLLIRRLLEEKNWKFAYLDGSTVCRNNLKNREFDKEAPQNRDSEQATIAEWQGASENRDFEVKPTTSKTDSSSCFGMDREGAVRQFQEDPSTHFFLISLKAGGVGLNLTKADYVLLFDPWWNEAVERQAIDRAHRLGREAPVVARRYVVASSIEEKMMSLKEHKKKLLGDLLQDAEDSQPSSEELLSLVFDDLDGSLF